MVTYGMFGFRNLGLVSYILGWAGELLRLGKKMNLTSIFDFSRQTVIYF